MTMHIPLCLAQHQSHQLFFYNSKSILAPILQVFFQLEREYLLQSQEDGPSNGAYTIKKILAQEREVESPEMVALRPPRYRHLILPADWYVVGSKYTGKGDPTSYRRDRKHRKTHGVITFVELTKLVSR